MFLNLQTLPGAPQRKLTTQHTTLRSRVSQNLLPMYTSSALAHPPTACGQRPHAFARHTQQPHVAVHSRHQPWLAGNVAPRHVAQGGAVRKACAVARRWRRRSAWPDIQWLWASWMSGKNCALSWVKPPVAHWYLVALAAALTSRWAPCACQGVGVAVTITSQASRWLLRGWEWQSQPSWFHREQCTEAVPHPCASRPCGTIGSRRPWCGCGDGAQGPGHMWIHVHYSSRVPGGIDAL